MIRRTLWLVVEYAAFAFWLPASWVVDTTERVMDASYKRTAR